jgi:hypothetical protein
MRYGSGTIENGPRLPNISRLTWQVSRFESERRCLISTRPPIFRTTLSIAKESKIPIQYAPSRTIGGSLRLHF